MNSAHCPCVTSYFIIRNEYQIFTFICPAAIGSPSIHSLCSSVRPPTPFSG